MRGLRKFLIAIISLAIFVVAFFVSQKFTGDNLVYGIGMIAIGYFGGNAIVSMKRSK